MSVCYGDWTIQTQQTRVVDENGKCKDEMVTSLDVEDIRRLPAAVYKLVEWGHDLSATAEAIKEAQEKQQKAKQAETLKEKREGIAQAKAALDSSIQRFIIAYNKKGEDEIKTAEGVRYGNGNLDIAMSAEFPIGGRARGEEQLRDIAERLGYEFYIEYID
jgi:hypothetical protein